MMDDKELERMGYNLNIEDDKQSVITTDKLKKFNEINGFDNGPATEQNPEDEEQIGGEGDALSNPNEGEEQRDEVHSLGQGVNLRSSAALKGKLNRNQDDRQSVISMSQRSVVSKRTVMSSNGTVKTSKTYISTLEKQLNEEKRAREKLELEIEEIKRINSEISSKLGLSSAHQQKRH